MDFLLKQEKLVIELKIATDKLKDKQVGEQLIVDIKRYETHPDCKQFVCFVYDPGGNLRNPNGIESDLSRMHGALQVKVIVLSV